MKCNVSFVNANGFAICDLGVDVDEAVRYANDFKAKSVNGEMIVIRTISDLGESLYTIRNDNGKLVGHMRC